MIGNYKSVLDEKNRITIPTKFREELGSFIVVSYGFDKTLEIRSSKSFEKWVETLSKKGNLASDSRKLSRIILGNSFNVTLDKAGRALIPKNLTGLINLTKEAMIIGTGNKLEIHTKEQWDDINSNPEEMAKILSEMAESLSKEQ